MSGVDTSQYGGEYDALEPGTVPRLRDLMPNKAQLEYTKEFITTALLIIALPWIIRFLLINPRGFAKSLSSVTP